MLITLSKDKILEVENIEQQRVIESLEPKASYYDLILQCKELITITSIAKDYGMSAKTLNKKLKELGIQYKLGEQWLLYAKYQGFGYTSSKTHNYSKSDGTQGAKPHTCWTQKGRLFLYELLKNNGIVPMIEKEKEDGRE